MSNLPIFDSRGQPVFPTSISPAELAATRERVAARTQAAIDARLKQEADARADVARRQAEQGAAELDAYREQARSAFLSSGGSVSEFVDAWPGLRREHLVEQARERVTLSQRTIAKTKEELRESGRYSM